MTLVVAELRHPTKLGLIRNSIHNALLTVLALCAVQASGSVVIEIGGGVPDHSFNIAPFAAAVTLERLSVSSPAQQTLSIPSAVVHVPILQPDSSKPPLGLMSSSNGEFRILDAANSTLFRFAIHSSNPSAPPSVNPADFPDNHAPVAINPTLLHGRDEPLHLPSSLLAGDLDADPLQVNIIAKAKWGVLATLESEVIYIPFGAFVERDTFTVAVTDGRGGVTQSVVTVINPISQFAGSYAGAVGQIGTLNAFISQGAGTVRLRVNGRDYRGVVKFPQSGPIGLNLSTGGDAPEKLYITLELINSPNPTLRLRTTIENNEIEVDFPKLTPEEAIGDYVGHFNLGLYRPQGTTHGYAIAKVSSEGSVRVTGYLPNGRPWSAGTMLSSDGKLTIAVPNGKGEPMLSGEWTLPHPTVGTEDCDFGDLAWTRTSRESALDVVGSRFESISSPEQNMFGETRTKLHFFIHSRWISRLTTVYQFIDPNLPPKPVGTRYVHDDHTRLAVNRQNQASQIPTGSALTTIALKRNGRFSGTYQGSGIPPLEFHGVLDNRGFGVGLIRNSAGYVGIYK